MTGGATLGLMGGGAGWGGITPEKGDWEPLTELVLPPYILLGEPGPDTRGPSTPGREKADEEEGGMEAVLAMLREDEN